MEQLNELKNLPITMDADFDTINAKVQAAMEPFKQMVVTSGTVIDYKNTRAELNKLADAIDTQRKSHEKLWMQPFDAYKAKVKALLIPINEAVANIDTQIKAFEAQEKEAKRLEIYAYYDQQQSPVSIEKVFKQTWLNAGTTEKQWKADVDAIVSRHKSDIILLTAQTDDPVLVNLYLETLDALQAIQRYNALKAPKVEQQPMPLFDFTKQEQKPEPKKETASTYTFEFFATPSDIEALMRWCQTMKIAVERK